MCGVWKTKDVSIDGLALLYVPNLSPYSYTSTKNDGLSLWFIIGFVVYNCPSYWWCWGDDKCDGNHSAGFLFGDIDLCLWHYCGTSWSAGGGTCWATWPSKCGSWLATCFEFEISTINGGCGASS